MTTGSHTILHTTPFLGGTAVVMSMIAIMSSIMRRRWRILLDNIRFI